MDIHSHNYIYNFSRIEMNKSQIREILVNLRKYNFHIKVFQCHRKIYNAVGMSDLLIIDNKTGRVVFVEIKINDKQSKEQVELMNYVNECKELGIIYILATKENVHEIHRLIAIKDYYNLKLLSKTF